MNALQDVTVEIVTGACGGIGANPVTAFRRRG